MTFLEDQERMYLGHLVSELVPDPVLDEGEYLSDDFDFEGHEDSYFFNLADAASEADMVASSFKRTGLGTFEWLDATGFKVQAKITVSLTPLSDDEHREAADDYMTELSEAAERAGL